MSAAYAMAGRAVAGARIGILTLATRHLLVPGNVQHAESFGFPVAYAVVENVSIPALMAGDPAALPPILAAVAQLERLGVDMIVGACGSFGNFHADVRAAASVPVCLSILAQLPMLLSTLPPDRKIACIFARTSSYSDRTRSQCGIDDQAGQMVLIGADALASFQPVLDPDLPLDSDALSRDLVDLCVRRVREDPSIALILFQCSDLPPYADAVARATGRPVFDMTLLIKTLHGAFNRGTMQ